MNGVTNEPTPHDPPPTQAQIVSWLAHLLDADALYEVRSPKVEGVRTLRRRSADGGYYEVLPTYAGHFYGREVAEIARVAADFSGFGNLYLTLNPLRPERFAQQAPRFYKADRTAADAHILDRRWMLLDIDRVKTPDDKKLPATQVQKDRAFALTCRVREYLTSEGFPAPTVIDSGNANYLLYRLPHLAVADPTPDDDPVRLVLQHLAERFDGADGTVDTTVYNPSRIYRLVGTKNVKGLESADRPHRWARLLEAPQDRETVPLALLLAIAQRAQKSAQVRAVAVSQARPGRTSASTAITQPDARQGGYTKLTAGMERRAKLVLDTIPPAIEGRNDEGSRHTLWAARTMVRGFLFSPGDAFELLSRYYNPRCQGPWSEPELERKVSEAVRKPFRMEDGWLLKQRADRGPQYTGYDDITPEEAAAIAASFAAEPPPEACSKATARRVLDNLLPFGHCEHPVPLATRSRSTGARGVSGFFCKNAKVCPACRRWRAFEKAKLSCDYINHACRSGSTNPDGSPVVPRVLIMGILPFGESVSLRQKFTRLGAEYCSIRTADPNGCVESSATEPSMSQFGPLIHILYGANCDTHLWLAAVSPDSAIPDGFVQVSPAAGIAAMGNAFSTVPPPPDGAAKYRFFHASYGWRSDEIEDAPNDLVIDGRVVFTLREVRDVLRENGICGEIGVRRGPTSIVAKYGVLGTPTLALAVTLMLRGVGTSWRPTRDRVSELIGDWMRVLPCVGDGRHVRKVLIANLWTTPLWDKERIRALLYAAAARDREEHEVALVAEPMVKSIRQQWRGREKEASELIRMFLV